MLSSDRGGGENRNDIVFARGRNRLIQNIKQGMESDESYDMVFNNDKDECLDQPYANLHGSISSSFD